MAPELLRMLQQAQQAALRTGGRFDATVGRLTRGVDGIADGELPSEQQVRQARAHIGHARLRLDAARQQAWITDSATRIENRVGEPAANPYLYIAAQIHAGLDGLARAELPPPGTDSPYAADHQKLPSSLGEGLDALRADPVLCTSLGDDLVRYFSRIKQSEIDRHAQAEDKLDFERREYFSRT